MATVQEQIAFIREFTPLSESAASQLHIETDFPLAQWALESGWGTAPNSVAIHNIAGIAIRGTQVNAAFASFPAMVASYVASMRADCPAIYHGEVSPESTVEQVLAGTAYNTVNHEYANEVASVMADIKKLRAEMNAPAPAPVEKVGDTGEAVRETQHELNVVDHAGLVEDGDYGQASAHAVEVFQEEHHLQVDGVDGAQTSAALETAYKEAEAEAAHASAPTQTLDERITAPAGKKVARIVVYFTDGTSEIIEH